MSRASVFVAVLLGVLVAFAACIFPPKEDTNGAGGGAGGAGPRGGGEGGAGDAADAMLVGTMCTVMTTAGPFLCEAVSACPGLVVNQNTWNGCGFVVAGKVFNLACECTGYLCPAPPTPSCDAAQLILQRETAVEVCGALDDGGCNQEFIPLGDSGI